jgi:hypothetical protein
MHRALIGLIVILVLGCISALVWSIYTFLIVPKKSVVNKTSVTVDEDEMIVPVEDEMIVPVDDVDPNKYYFIVNKDNVTMHSDSGAPGSDMDPEAPGASTGNISFCCNQKSPWTSWKFEQTGNKDEYYIVNMNSGQKLTVYLLEDDKFTFNRSGATKIKYVNSPIVESCSTFILDKNLKEVSLRLSCNNSMMDKYLGSVGSTLSLDDTPYIFTLETE